ncbi:MAG: hypothetical protein II272_04830 [Oscillospiraceae bacterium]|nr:hypothetical protein [Oscillospiraceae bacterium]
MKQSVIRMLCAVLLLLLGVGILAGAIAAVTGQKEKQRAYKVDFSLRPGEELRLYDEKGSCIAQMWADSQGLCTSGLLETGDYYGACTAGMVYFRIEDEGLTQVGGAATRKEEGVLSFRRVEKGSLTVETVARGQWYTYELFSSLDSRQRVLRCREGEQLRCSFEDLPLGIYRLEENGRFLCTVELTEEEAHRTLHLP